MILVTAQRPGEVVGIESHEIDGTWWTIPEEKAKNNREHRVYLTSLAKEMLCNGDKYPFPAADANTPLHVNTLGRAVRRLIKAHNKTQEEKDLPLLEPFTPHDLRRTAATYMAELKVTEFVIGKVLNHTNESITGVYNRYAYDDEKQQALTVWAERLEEIINSTDD